MKIQFDETNLLAGAVGEDHGITPAELDQHRGQALEALAGFRKQAETDLIGFPHLPFQAAVIQAVRAYARELRGSFDTVCLVGIGGSALGAWALDCGIRGPHPVQGAHSPQRPRRTAPLPERPGPAGTSGRGRPVHAAGVLPRTVRKFVRPS